MTAPGPDYCQHEARGGRRGPSVTNPSYQLALNGDEHLFRARLDVATWADRVHRAATLVQAQQ